MRTLLLLLCCAGCLRADAVADLKALLLRQSATTPVAAQVAFAYTDTHGEEKAATTTTGQATAQVALAAAGLRIVWSPDQLTLVAREQAEAAGQPKPVMPTREAMRRLDGATLLDYFMAAPQLLRVLEIAQLTGEQADTWQGQPARRLTFKLNLPLSEEDRKMIKQIDATAQIWLAADGQPLAAERNIALKGRALLVISFEHVQKETFTYARAGERLVVVSHVQETMDKGGGQHSRTQSQTTLTLQDP